MRIVLAIAAAFAIFMAAPAFASEHGGGEHGAEGAEKAEKSEKGEHGKKEPGTGVDMPFLIAPLNDGEGKLVGYAYVSARIQATSMAAVADVREKIPFIQDAFVRDVNGKPINTPEAPEEVSKPALIARLIAIAKRIVGPGKIASYTITQLQIASAKPKAG
jgi:hypothetical protein